MPFDPPTRHRPRRRSRRLPARLSGHLRAADDGRGRPRGRDSRGAADHPPTRGRAVHEGRALPRPHVFRPARAASDAARRAQGRGPLRAHRAGTRRSTTIAARFAAIAATPTARRRSCPTAMRATWACCSTARWTGASSTGSARSCSTARSARPPARRAGPRSIGASMGMDVEQYVEQQADRDLGQQPDHVEPAFLDACAGSQAPRREARRDRSVPQRDRGEMPRAHRADAGHRRARSRSA